MSDNLNEIDLKDRLKLIESMITEGRRTTANYGWTFVLWGVAYFIATGWATWGHSNLAWPITMIAASIGTAAGISRVRRGQPETAIGRALGGIWTAQGIAIFILLLSLSFSGKYDTHIFVAIIGAMLGAANGASAIVLKWAMQFACAAVWMAAAVVASFGSETQTSTAFLAATFFGQIVFGIYAMVRESRSRQRGAVHA